jgi:beta-galactosidase
LEKDVLKKVYETAGIGIKELPEGVIINWRDGFYIANNYSSATVTLDIPQTSKIIFGTKEMTPAGVIVWK